MGRGEIDLRAAPSADRLPEPGGPVAAVVAMDAVTKRYRGGGGIDGVSLRIDAGEVLAFLGPNGAGKTTTIRLLLDLIRPDSGTIRLFGLDPRRSGVAVRRRIGYLPGELGLYDRLTPRELLTHFAHLRSGPPWEEIAALAARFALELDRPIRSLSKGNRQKVGLVQALMGRPDLLILDEPTAGLDPLVQHQVLGVIREAAARGCSVFLSSHILSEVAQVADRVGMIKEGRLISVERVEDLRARSVHVVDLRLADGDGSGEATRLAALPGVVVRAASPAQIQLEVTGSLDPLIAELARCRVADLVVREPSLEELFLGAFGVPLAPPTGDPVGGDRVGAP